MPFDEEIPAAARGTLTLRRTADGDHHVEVQLTGHGRLPAGLIMRVHQADERLVWHKPDGIPGKV